MAGNNPKANAPEGFGAGTTGGAGGEVVQVKTAADLKYQLCRTSSGVCTDDKPRIIQIVGTIDLTGSEGKTSLTGCDYGVACSAPNKTETIVMPDSNYSAYCSGKATRQITYDKAGDQGLWVGSNKTVIGVGSTAVIKGKGLRLFGGAKNIIIRNLTISDINEGIVFAGDGITMNDVDHVWIDHNRFQRIGRQMIVGGFDPTTNVTISWNDFDGNSLASNTCNNTHYWNVLLVADTQTVTFSNNLLRATAGRAPKVDGKSALVHLVNNYYQHNTGHALDTHSPAKVLVEGNYFEDVNTPITANSEGGYIFGALGGPNAATQMQCKSVLGRNCYGNIAKPAPSVNGFAQEATVMNAFKSVSKSAVVVPYSGGDVPATVKASVGPGKI